MEATTQIPHITLREVEPSDADPCAQIVFDAFGAIHDHHRFQRDLRSLSLYTSLGFDVTASCVVMQGEPRGGPDPEVEVRPVKEDDVEACESLCVKVHGFPRTGALRDSIEPFKPYAALRDGRLVAYASTLSFWPMAYGVAEDDEAMKALMLGAAADLGEPIGMLMPLQ